MQYFLKSRDLYRPAVDPGQSFSECFFDAALDRFPREVAAIHHVPNAEAVKDIEGFPASRSWLAFLNFWELRMAIFRLSPTQQEDFARFPEIYPGAQLGFVVAREFERACLIVCDQIAILVDENLPGELDKFFKMVWRDQDRLLPSGADKDETIRNLYATWMGELPEAEEGFAMEAVSRSYLTGIVTGTLPAPPPTRPTVAPGAPHGRGTLPSTPAHLPFHTVSKQSEIFYRWEAWPRSRRVHPTGNVDPWTFASPEAELKLIETGFAAVGRAALPSFFPHVFRWKLEPPAGTSMLCGAVVPMYGQAGGGVEVCFDLGASNVTASQVIIEPL